MSDQLEVDKLRKQILEATQNLTRDEQRDLLKYIRKKTGETRGNLCFYCDELATTKCTKCGEAFCKAHIRYGNPHFAFGKIIRDGQGNYCDLCWSKFKNKYKTSRRMQIILAGVVFLVAVLYLASRIN